MKGILSIAGAFQQAHLASEAHAMTSPRSGCFLAANAAAQPAEGLPC